MDTTRWQRLSPLLDELFELEAHDRARRLDELRADDPDLAVELEALIALEVGQEDFLSEPVVSPQRGVLPGNEVGPYRLERLLGEGGMGQVWLAARADGLYQRRVALKLLRPGLADTNLRVRFTRERQILARLAHPHIARLLDAGISADGLPYLALEHVDGAPITDYCREHRTPVETRLRMFGQICEAVSHAHANLIVHRDLKPSNILVTPAGEVRLLDFGIAKLLDTDPAPEQTRTGVRAFTLHYAAPEQIRGEPVTTMTDVYSLGVVLYELLSDQKPYRPKRESDAAWEEAILTGDPLRPSLALQRTADARRNDPDAPAMRRRARMLAGDLDNIVLKTLSKTPEQRYPSVEALAQDLQRHAAGRPVHARSQSLNYRMAKYIGRHRWALGSGGLVALMLTASLGVVAWQAREAVREAARAQAMQDFMVGVFERAGGTRDGDPLNLRQLLATAVERGDRELARQPRALAELLGVIARLRTGLGDYDEASALLERQATLIAGTDAPPSLQLESLTQRGRVLRMLGDDDGCRALMEPSLAMAQREQAQLPPQVTEFYSQLGRCRRAGGQLQGARQLFERSLSLRRTHHADPVGEVENLMDLAGLYADAGQTDTALAEFDAARRKLRAEAGDRHPLLVDIHRNLARLHRARGELAPARQQLLEALAIATDLNGPGHMTTLAVERQLASVLADEGRHAEAIARLESVQEQLAGRHGDDHPVLADGYARLGRLAWERGDLPAATTALRRALALRRSTGAAGPIADALVDLGTVLHQGGQDRPAHPLLLEALELRQRHQPGDHARVGEARRLLGVVELSLGPADSGLERLGQGLEQSRRHLGDAHPETRRTELVLATYHARSAVDAMSVDTAMARLDALAALPGGELELRQLTWQAGARAAALRCTGTGRAAATQELDRLDAVVRQAQPEGGVISRELAAIRAGCDLPDAPRSLAGAASAR